MRKKLAIAVLLVAPMTFVGCAVSSPTQSGGGVEEYSTAYKLATIANGEPPRKAEELRFQAALDAAAPKCVQNELGISDVVAKGVVVAEGVGVTLGHYELLEAITESVPSGVGPVDCSDVVATLISLMAPPG